MGKELLVGSTGFVGQNLALSHSFDKAVHSTNIREAFEDAYDCVVYAGVTGTKFLANLSSEADLAIIEGAKQNLERIKADLVVLISTVDVYGKQKGLCETDEPSGSDLDSYGLHRLQLEQWLQSHYQNYLIVRLPAIYGKGLKKNFVYDLIHRSPAFLDNSQYSLLKHQNELIVKNYSRDNSGLWRNTRAECASDLDDWFATQQFNALSFTDSRSIFQFYSLGRLWDHINLALEKQTRILNIAPPPLAAGEVYEYVFGAEWVNELEKPIFDYDMRSCVLTSDTYSDYLESEANELEQLKQFVLAKSLLLP